MNNVIVGLLSGFIAQLGVAIFAGGKLWQRVSDIDKTVTEIKKIVFSQLDCGEKDEDDN